MVREQEGIQSVNIAIPIPDLYYTVGEKVEAYYPDIKRRNGSKVGLFQVVGEPENADGTAYVWIANSSGNAAACVESAITDYPFFKHANDFQWIFDDCEIGRYCMVSLPHTILELEYSPIPIPNDLEAHLQRYDLSPASFRQLAVVVG